MTNIILVLTDIFFVLINIFLFLTNIVLVLTDIVLVLTSIFLDQSFPIPHPKKSIQPFLIKTVVQKRVKNVLSLDVHPDKQVAKIDVHC